MLMSPAACRHFSEGDILGPGEVGVAGKALELDLPEMLPTPPDRRPRAAVEQTTWVYRNGIAMAYFNVQQLWTR